MLCWIKNLFLHGATFPAISLKLRAEDRLTMTGLRWIRCIEQPENNAPASSLESTYSRHCRVLRDWLQRGDNVIIPFAKSQLQVQRTLSRYIAWDRADGAPDKMDYRRRDKEMLKSNFTVIDAIITAETQCNAVDSIGRHAREHRNKESMRGRVYFNNTRSSFSTLRKHETVPFIITYGFRILLCDGIQACRKRC